MSKEKAKMEALLFFAGGPISKKRLCTLMECSPETLDTLAKEMMEEREAGGVTVIDSGTHLLLATHADFSEDVEQMRKIETNAPLSKAAQETLSIIAYIGPVSKSDLDFLRGVNTQYTLRRLAMKGLVREQKEGRGKVIGLTPDFLAHMGITSVDALPDYEHIRTSILSSLAAIKTRMSERE